MKANHPKGRLGNIGEKMAKNSPLFAIGSAESRRPPPGVAAVTPDDVLAADGDAPVALVDNLTLID